MDKYIDERFERVQRALTSLIDSITKYHPSTTQANDLATADKELSDGLHELQKHQNNYLRIQELKKETEDLDSQIKSTVSLLWGIRKEITGTPTTSYPSSGPRYEFTYSDLLNYARRIASNTVPPSGVTDGIDLSAPPPDQQQQTSAEQAPVSAQGDIQHPQPQPQLQPATNGAVATTSQPSVSDASQPPLPGSDPPREYPTALPPYMENLVNNFGDAAFFQPWPTEGHIRSGGLDICQRLASVGVDPRGYDPEEVERQRRVEAEERKRREAVEDEERKRREEERFAQIARERAAAQERERHMALEAGGGQQQQQQGGASGGTAGTGAARPGEKKQFQFMGLGDDDDEEDED